MGTVGGTAYPHLLVPQALFGDVCHECVVDVAYRIDVDGSLLAQGLTHGSDVASDCQGVSRSLVRQFGERHVAYAGRQPLDLGAR